MACQHGEGNAMTARAQGAFMTQTAVGSPATCAAKIEAFLRDCDIDGLMFIYDDYPAGLARHRARNPARICARPSHEDAEWIAPNRTALVVIDCQVDFGSPDGEMARRGADMTAPPGGAWQRRCSWSMPRAPPACRIVFVRLLTHPGGENRIVREAKAAAGR